jgi:CRISPR-associated protein Cas1
LRRLVVDGYGRIVSRHGKQIIVREKGRVLHRVTPENLRQIVLMGRGSITFDALRLLSEYGVDVIALDRYGRLAMRLSTGMMRTVRTRREQYKAYGDERSGHLSKGFIYAKMRNQYALLGTFAKTRRDTHPEDAELLLEGRGEIKQLMERLQRVEDQPIEEIRGHLMALEAMSSKIYWGAVEMIIPESFGFEGRSGRGAVDPVNAMLNYGYALLQGEVWRGVHYAGLDPYGGFLHTDRPGRPSLVLDLMEEFRQQLVDKTTLSLVTKREVAPEDFHYEEGRCLIGERVRRKLIKRVLEKFEKHQYYRGIRRRWCDIIHFQAVEVAKYLRGETKSYEGFYLRW